MGMNRSLAMVAVLGIGVAIGWSVSQMTEKSERGEEAEEAAGVEVGSGSGGDSANLAAAKITKDSATILALAQVPGGTVKSAELENEDGKLLYSFDIAVAGKEGIEEIHIGATDGAFLGRSHESATEEAGEGEKEGQKPAAAKRAPGKG